MFLLKLKDRVLADNPQKGKTQNGTQKYGTSVTHFTLLKLKVWGLDDVLDDTLYFVQIEGLGIGGHTW